LTSATPQPTSPFQQHSDPFTPDPRIQSGA